MLAETIEEELNTEVDGAVIDLAALLERCADDASIAVQLLVLFQDRLPNMIGEIASDIRDGGDPAHIARKVHILRGNSGDLGACRLHRAASLLEDAVRSQHSVRIASLLTSVENNVAEFLMELPKALDSLA